MAENDCITQPSYIKSGRLVKRAGSRYWYIYLTDSAGRRVRQSTRLEDEARARRYMNDYLDMYGGGALFPDWKMHITRELKARKSWVREMLNKVASRERARNAGVSVSKLRGEMVDVLIRSNGRCELTDVQFSMDNPGRSRARPFIASIDRIDSSQGYSYSNCRAVCACVNMALSDWGDDVFRMICTGYTTKLIGNAVVSSGDMVFRPVIEKAGTNSSRKDETWP